MTETKYWTTPDGKEIEYQEKLLYQIFYEEVGWYKIIERKWPKNTDLIIFNSYDLHGDVLDPSIVTRITRVCKLPHLEYESKKDELIQKAYKYIAEATDGL